MLALQLAAAWRARVHALFVHDTAPCNRPSASMAS